MSEVEEEGVQESVEVERIETPVEEETVLYDASRPELLDVMLDVVEIYDQAAEGKVSVEDARARTEEVEKRLRNMLRQGLVVKKKKAKVQRPKRAERKKKAKKRGKKGEKSE
ncbi:MAG: hypothetical protein ABDH61_05620 [Acidilobaceae archaeon]